MKENKKSVSTRRASSHCKASKAKQVEAFDCWANRSVYYLSKMYAGEIKEGEGYDCLKKCIHVSILAYDHFRDDKECYRRIAFCDTKTGKEYTDLMEMHILELSKLPPEEKNETSLLQWMRFLGGKTRKDFEEISEKIIGRVWFIVDYIKTSAS